MGRASVAVRATVVAFLATLVSLLLTGCGIVKQYTERDLYRERFCYPRGSIDREKHKITVGIGCRF